MRISPNDRNYIIISTTNGQIHVSEENGITKIVYYDHFNIQIIGKNKREPLIVIDSDEFPTQLHIKETEAKWIAVLEVGHGKSQTAGSLKGKGGRD